MHLARFKSLAKCLYKISLIKELLPDPDTPVTQVNVPSGNDTLIFLRLFSLAPTILINLPLPTLLLSGTIIFLLPDKY